MKIYSSAIMGTIPKTAGHPFDFLDLAVDRLAQGICDAMPCIGNNIIYMSLNRLRRLLNRLQPGMHSPKIPAFKIFPHRGFISVTPTFKVEVQQKQKRPQAVFCSPGISWVYC